jgi:hypothetical protein
MERPEAVQRGRITARRDMGKLAFLDVVEKFRSLPPEEVESLYVRPWDGHLSPKGNEYVAKVLYERLVSIPQIAEKFRAGSDRLKTTRAVDTLTNHTADEFKPQIRNAH